MKQFGKRFLSVLCLLAILASLPVLAFAEGESSAAQEKGLEAIRGTGDEKYLKLPNAESYLDEFKTKYVDITQVMILVDGSLVPMYGPAAAVDRNPGLKGSLHMPYAYQGTKVTVVAEQSQTSCILYRSSEGKMRAGWIRDIYLSDNYPGKVLTVGKENSSASGTVAEVPMSWSREGFLGGQQNYSVLAEPVKNCVGFTLDYQLIQENTDKWGTILGPRTVYVNDGSEWIKVGSFEYPEFGPVQVRVNLEKPIDIVAIGTIAECSQPNLFRFRQFATDYATAA